MAARQPSIRFNVYWAVLSNSHRLGNSQYYAKLAHTGAEYICIVHSRRCGGISVTKKQEIAVSRVSSKR